ncbi:Uncharacterized protein FKW44_010868 [Caligus rogercresseyi]|uniref:Uncharacterized protein n=1 Tax=Caligus rogercresseyi TaxID=217165 RepID=A0A7T8K8E2_CALRO|nr:Uncharacterized protein FKW44_010868 [Caligus rogercresseyi]
MEAHARQAHAHPHDRCGRREKAKAVLSLTSQHSWPTSCRDPTETSRWLSTTSCTPHFEDQSGPITTHTSIPKEHESSFLPPLYPCKRPTISPESPCPLQPSTSSYKGPHRAPTPLWLQGYNYSPRNTHS